MNDFLQTIIKSDVRYFGCQVNQVAPDSQHPAPEQCCHSQLEIR